MKSEIAKMKYFSLIIIFCLIFISCSRSKEKYIITDVNLKGEFAQNRQNRILENTLGKEITLDFFDSKVKATYDMGGNEEIIILDKINDNRYRNSSSKQIWEPEYNNYSLQHREVIIDFNPILGIYNNSMTVSWYQDGKLLMSVSAKKK